LISLSRWSSLGALDFSVASWGEMTPGIAAGLAFARYAAGFRTLRYYALPKKMPAAVLSAARLPHRRAQRPGPGLGSYDFGGGNSGEVTYLSMFAAVSARLTFLSSSI
jgi:hypothetical protein